MFNGNVLKFTAMILRNNQVLVNLHIQTCVLIKLARSHPSIDFIIYQSDGPIHTRRPYFVQVSSSPYQSRPKEKKISAVENKFGVLSDVSVYSHY